MHAMKDVAHYPDVIGVEAVDIKIQMRGFSVPAENVSI